MTVEMTLPSLLHRNATAMGNRPAMREKRGGIWQAITWSDYATLVARFASGLAAHGFGRGDKLAVIGDNRVRLYAALLAAQSLGGAGVPLWPDAEPEWIAQVLDHAGVSVLVAEDAEQVEKILAIKDRLPDLALLVYAGSRGMPQLDLAWLTSFDTVAATGTATAPVEQGGPNDLALLLYASDANGEPRGVMLSHANLLAAAHALSAAEDVRQTDEALAWLPMAWFGDVLTSQALALAVGFTCNCPEGPETARRDLREIGPTILLAPPRIWESMLADIEARAAQASRLKRAVFRRFRALAERVEQQREAGHVVSLKLRLGLAVGERLVYAPVRDQIGLRRTRWANTGGEPLAPDVLRFFRAFGVNLKQSYGMAELAGIVAIQGQACAGVEISVAADEEVLIRGAAVCLGYYGDPQQTRQAVTADGRWRTGDAGRLEARSRLVILDRMAHLGRLTDGSVFVPRMIEDKLRHSRFIAEAIALGHDQPFVATMIAIDPIAVGNWAQSRNVGFTALGDLAAAAAVRQLIRDEIRACNASLPPAARVRRFLLLDGPPATGSEASLSRQLRRRMVLAGNVALAESLFPGRVVTAGPTDVPDDVIVAIEEVEEATAAWEPAHA